MKRTVPQSQMAENMTTSIFLIGNEFHFRPPPFAIGSEAEKRKHRADKARERRTQRTALFLWRLKPACAGRPRSPEVRSAFVVPDLSRALAKDRHHRAEGVRSTPLACYCGVELPFGLSFMWRKSPAFLSRCSLRHSAPPFMALTPTLSKSRSTSAPASPAILMWSASRTSP